MEDQRCHICDRTDGYSTNAEDHPPACACDLCVSLCWGGAQCVSRAVDWRERALQAKKDAEYWERLFRQAQADKAALIKDQSDAMIAEVNRAIERLKTQ